MYVQWSQSFTLFPMIEASKLIALQALLAFGQHLRHRAALKRLAQDHRETLANLRERYGRRPFFSPAASPAPGTTWPVTKAFDDAASRSNGGPHNRPNPPRSCSAGDILRCDVRPSPLGPTPPAVSQGLHWTDKSPLSRPNPGRGHGSDSPPTIPRRLADADGFWRPRAV
jgi:hypothetical protein